MRQIVRHAAGALCVACLAASAATISDSAALAQTTQPAPAQAVPPQQQEPRIKQMALTEMQVEGVLAATREMDPVTEKIPQDAKPDPKIVAQLDDIAKKNGFASLDEYNNVVDNISLVLGGIDPATRKYVGAEAMIKAQIAVVQADKKMSAKDKKEALADLAEALKSPPPAIENKGNIDLVAKYYDKLADALGMNDQE